MTRPRRPDRVSIVSIGGYLAIWMAATAILARNASEQPSQAAAMLVVFGVLFTGIAILTTRGATRGGIAVRRPVRGSVLILIYLCVYAVGFAGYGLTAFHAAVAPGRVESCLLIALKLAIHVALPCLLLAWSGETPRGFFTASVRGRAFWLTLTVLGVASLTLLSVISPSLKQISELGLAPSSLMLATLGAFGWIAVEAGLCEEFLFRSVLQSHLSAALQSPIAAVLLSSLIFALAHGPGLYLRGDPGDQGQSKSLLEVLAYTVAVLSPAGVFLGVVWWRTRNLLLVVLLHACIDVLPFLPKFAGMWF